MDVTRINLFPIKSLDGVSVAAARVLDSGACEHDRRFAIVDAGGRIVNGKRCPALHQIRATFTTDCERVQLAHADTQDSADFALHRDRDRIEHWLSAILNQPVILAENITLGFPDDTDSPGPTVISTGTLATVVAWFPGATVDEIRRRFRANIEVESEEPFAEERLIAEHPASVVFRIGSTILRGTTACQRCVVPTREPQSGAVTTGFQQMFSARREQTLPNWSPRNRFDHFYRLSINTQPVLTADDHAESRFMRIGDVVEIIRRDVAPQSASPRQPRST